MAPDPNIMKAVEQLDYRVTVGDVASQAGLDVKLAERGLLALASEAGGHMQVSEAGEIAYVFPQNFRNALQSKYFRLRLQATWNRIWKTLFYLIRISFGILLILSIVLIVLAITIIFIAMMSSNREGNDDRRSSSSGGGGFIFFPRFFFGPDLFWYFSPNYYERRAYQRRQPQRRGAGQENQMNFLEAVFSFLFGDGDPNANLEEYRWRAIATVIRNNGGAVAAEQIAPYLDDLGSEYSREYEDYMLPVLTRFNGRPEVSPEGQIIYHFPALQVTAQEQGKRPVAAYLKEALWKFSEAGSGQLTAAAGLGIFNLVAAIVLGVLLGDGAIAQELGGLVAFVNGIYWLLLGYGTAFLAVPTIRFFWLKQRNVKVAARNEKRLERAEVLNAAGDEIREKIAFAHQFAAETVIDPADLAYTTEQDLTEQEYLNSDRIDEEWRRRIEQSQP